MHLHGDLSLPKCFACNRPALGLPDQPVLPDHGALIEPIRCLRCNVKMRPAVVWYGEDLPAQSWKAAIQLVKNCNVLISVGTSGVVIPAAGLPELALAAGAAVIHVNITDVSLGNPYEYMLTGNATEILPALLASMEADQARRMH